MDLYELMGSYLLLVLLVGVLIVFYIYNNMDKEKLDKVLRTMYTSEIIFLFVSALIGYTLYAVRLNELKDAFASNKELICQTSEKQIYKTVINKQNGYSLKDGYLIKNNHAIDIASCQTLEEQ